MNIEQKKKIMKMIDFLWRSTFDANGYFQVIKQFEDNRIKYSDEMEVSSAFYLYTYNALVIATFSEVSRLFDKGGNTNLEILMKYCEKHTLLIQQIWDENNFDEEKNLYHTFKDDEKEFFIKELGAKLFPTESIKLSLETKFKLFRWKYNKLNQVVENLKSQRDKIYSHNDAKSIESMDKYIKRYPISIENMELLIVFSLEYLQFLIAIITNTNKPSHAINIDDWEGTLMLVQLGDKYSEYDTKKRVEKIMKEN